MQNDNKLDRSSKGRATAVRRFLTRINHPTAMLTPERKQALYNALQDRGFYNPYEVFSHPPEIGPATDSRYDCMVSVVKWNTSSSRVIRLNARWDSERQKYTLSTYKTGSVARQKHGEKMR